MRDEKLYLQDIIQAADDIAEFMGNNTREYFFADRMLQSAVLQKLMIIGEAASRLSKELRECYSEVIWSDVVAFRNFAIHAYFALDLSIVWHTATKDVPDLKTIVSRILAEEYPDNT